MNSANFNQILCKSVSSNGESITGIFDTLLCEKGKNSFYIYVLATQIPDGPSSDYDKYYYRIVLRRFGTSKEEQKHYRVDNGIFWEDEHAASDAEEETIQSKYKTTRPGSSEKLVIECEHDFEVQGSYEVDLYVKKLGEAETEEDCQKLNVKHLELVSICPFQVIFSNEQ